MLGKVHASGKGAGGLVGYLTKQRDVRALTDYMTGDQHVIGAVGYRNLLAETPREAAREMALTAKLSGRCLKPFMHLSVQWHPDEQPTNEQMIAAMDASLAKLGLGDHQAVYAIHLEKGHAHIHAAVNRVSDSGRAWADYRSAERFIEATREVEKEMGFENRDEQIERARAEGRGKGRDLHPTPRQQRIAERSGREPDLHYQEQLQQQRERADAFADRVKHEAKTALRSAQTWADAHAALAQHGLGLREFVSPKNPARKGLEVVEIETGARCAASDLGSDYGRAKLEKRLGAFERGPENERVEALRGASDRSADPEAVREPGRASEPAEGAQTRTDTPLWREYQADRMHRATTRQQAWDQQAAHDRARRGALRDQHRAERDRLRASDARGSAYKALRSALAFEHAKQRELLGDTIRDERDRLRNDTRQRTWTEFVVDCAAAENGYAIEQLSRWSRKQQRSLDYEFVVHDPRPERETPPLTRKLSELTYTVDRYNGNVHYRWRDSDSEAFTDYGSRISIRNGHDRDAMRATLQLARQKWGDTVGVKGSDDFKRAITEIATELGMKVSNAEMREYQQQLERERRERQALRDRERQERAERAQAEREARERAAQEQAEREERLQREQLTARGVARQRGENESEQSQEIEHQNDWGLSL
ncbi:MAG: relaxase/mobilization nuclease domain-containing protein [Candidatus Eremiobacteraeota bacterium]|nr:relaxase/mobilization nuclease domain-containing protein [Candidatus Eremiobacteraeota bacterium]